MPDVYVAVHDNAVATHIQVCATHEAALGWLDEWRQFDDGPTPFEQEGLAARDALEAWVGPPITSDGGTETWSSEDLTLQIMRQSVLAEQ